eukprot:51681-Eustigmatos_ZCMA.PRE.2
MPPPLRKQPAKAGEDSSGSEGEAEQEKQIVARYQEPEAIVRVFGWEPSPAFVLEEVMLNAK